MIEPDKIYLNVTKEYSETDDALEVATWDTKEYENCVNVSYIRKEAIINWLNEQLVAAADRFDFRAIAFKQTIDKVNSL